MEIIGCNGRNVTIIGAHAFFRQRVLLRVFFGTARKKASVRTVRLNEGMSAQTSSFAPC